VTQRLARLVAFYLPQFHPIPENDRWWGTGFTEWTNVAGARPLFRGHRQPHVPADLGFYDLRLAEVRVAQADLARAHGIEAFCYWHYWFHGKRLLERPFEEVLASGQPDFPFCLAWANEPWTRTWLGRHDILLDQTYSPADDLAHIRSLLPALADDRYLRVEQRPVLLVYRPTDLPDPARTTDTFRSECVRNGLPEPFLLGMNGWCKTTDTRALGFDATVDFEPQLSDLPGAFSDERLTARLRRAVRVGVPDLRLKVYDYDEVRARMAARRDALGFPVYPTIFVGWDNTPRRGRRAIVITGATPERFKAGLALLVDEAQDQPAEHRLVFVNAWNEWGEGNHLEPDLATGHAHLEAARQVAAGDAPQPPQHLAARH
jgi:lipopolysaccharide biosynthesis protein